MVIGLSHILKFEIVALQQVGQPEYKIDTGRNEVHPFFSQFNISFNQGMCIEKQQRPDQKLEGLGEVDQEGKINYITRITGKDFREDQGDNQQQPAQQPVRGDLAPAGKQKH